MELREGTIIPGTRQPVGEGINDAFRAVLRVDGQAIRAVVKDLPDDGVAAECYCALVMRYWELPVPEPVLVREADKLLFGSLDIDYPNLKHRIGWCDNHPEAIKVVLQRMACMVICEWPDAPHVLAVDELIGNTDRNLGNFLWDGVSHAYIDHERTLGRVTHKNNLMAIYAKYAGKSADCQRAAVANSLTMAAPPVPRPVAGIDFSVHAAYVAAKIASLASLVLRRFPKPDDLLSQVD